MSLCDCLDPPHVKYLSLNIILKWLDCKAVKQMRPWCISAVTLLCCSDWKHKWKPQQTGISLWSTLKVHTHIRLSAVQSHSRERGACMGSVCALLFLPHHMTTTLTDVCKGEWLLTAPGHLNCFCFVLFTGSNFRDHSQTKERTTVHSLHGI